MVHTISAETVEWLNGPKKIRLSTNPTEDELRALKLGDVVYLHGSVYTAREGVYIRVVEDKHPLPLELPKESAANFHCSPVPINDDGSINMGESFQLHHFDSVNGWMTGLKSPGRS